MCVCVFSCDSCSPQQVSATEEDLELETWSRKAITVVERSVLFVVAVPCGLLLMRPGELVNNEMGKR